MKKQRIQVRFCPKTWTRIIEEVDTLPHGERAPKSAPAPKIAEIKTGVQI